ncbi:polysaccharide lyase [Pedobacter glucosidilyticus]|uniref:polysaccharide lyase n=1 Tax=Pedobacter glucosidilyticus TaxID=1122941 RepID=UPI0003F7795A|nr:hypothetical protein [Pedobacter glucosidilyticus]
MIQKQQPRNVLSLSLLLIAGLFTACENDLQPLIGEQNETTQARAVYSTRTVNWNNRTDGAYTEAEADTDFGNVSGWNEARAYNSSGTARVKLEPNALSNEGGMISNIDISDGSEYELQYDVKFHSQFDWSRGGKVGFGFKIGDGNTGCDKADDGNGGSARIMWYTDNNGVTKLKPYIYYKDMPGNCGYDFGKVYPASGSIQKGSWYTVKIYVKSNTGSNTNGRLRVTIEGDTILDTAIRWTTNDAKRLINTMPFTSFRGGSDSYWESSTVGYIYYDNLSWTKIN